MGGEEEVHRPLSTMEGGSDFRKEKSEKIEAEWKKETRLKNIAFAKDLWVLHLLSEVIMYLPTDTYWIPTMCKACHENQQQIIFTLISEEYQEVSKINW